MTDLSLAAASAMNPLDPGLFRAAMRRPANAVTIITAAGPEGRAGVTATAVCSLSDSPPMLLVCLHRMGAAVPAIRAAGAFCVNFLSEEQAPLAALFAGRGDLRGDARFDPALWDRLATGAPVLRGALASFDCSLAEEFDGPTHAIFTGRVDAVATAAEAAPLVYSDGAFARIAS